MTREMRGHGRTSIDTEYLYSIRLEVKSWQALPAVAAWSEQMCSRAILLAVDSGQDRYQP